MKIDNILQNQSLLGKMGPIGGTTTDAVGSTDSSTSSDNSGLSFVDTLKQKLDDVNNQQLEADAVTNAFIKGDNVDVHQVMISAEEAKQSLEMAVQIRNKLVEAFQEINKMQL